MKANGTVILCALVAICATGRASAAAETPQVPLRHGLLYRIPAPDSDKGWEDLSLPVGCGHFGASVFGIVTNERIQVTWPSLHCAWENGKVTSYKLTPAAAKPVSMKVVGR